MDNPFLVYIDRLRDGDSVLIEETASPDFLDIDESDLRFPSPVKVQGKASLAGDHIVLQLEIATDAEMPCTICNQFVKLPIKVIDFAHAEPTSEVINHIFDYTELLRESILLQVPAFIECHNGKCPEREAISSFLKKNDDKEKKNGSEKDPVYFPFADL